MASQHKSIEVQRVCASCLVVGITTPATTTRNQEAVCDECAADIDAREEQAQGLREAYEQRENE